MTPGSDILTPAVLLPRARCSLNFHGRPRASVTRTGGNAGCPGPPSPPLPSPPRSSSSSSSAQDCSSSINRSGCTSALVTLRLLTDAQLPASLRYRNFSLRILIHSSEKQGFRGERQPTGATRAAFSSKEPKGKKGEKPSSGITLLVMPLHTGF